MDPTTVILVLALHLVCSGVLMHLIGRRMPNAGLGPWAAGAVLFGLAYVGRLAIGLASTGLWVLLLDLGMVLATLLFIRGLHAFFNQRMLPPAWYAAALAGYALLHWWAITKAGAQGRHVMLNAVLGLSYAALSISSLLEIRRQAPPLRPSLLLLGGLMGGQAVLTMLRAGYIASQGVGALYSGLQAQLFYGYSSVTAVLLALNLLWMVFVRLNMRLAAMATRDALTDTLNRNGLMDALARHFARRDAPSLLFLLVDLDHFKQINDRWGHAMGDQVLQAVAGTLTLSLRGADFIARVGGEEFLIGCTSADASVALQLAERLRAAIASLRLRSPDGEPVPCTASIGVSLPMVRLDRWEAAAHEADKALYAAKAAGRNCVRASATA